MAGAGGGIFTGGEPLSDQGRLTAGDFSEHLPQNWHAFFRWSNVDRVYLAVWSGLQAVSRALGVVVSWMEQQRQRSWSSFSPRAFLRARSLARARDVLSLPAGASMPRCRRMLVAACAVAAAALILAALAHTKRRTHSLVPHGSRRRASPSPACSVADPWLRLGLLELGALLTVLLVWHTARTHAAKFTYLAVVAHLRRHRWSQAICSSSAASRIGRARCCSPASASSWPPCRSSSGCSSWPTKCPPLVLGLIIAVVDMAAFGEFYIAAHASPGLFTPAGLWLCIAAATSFLAALLMLTQRSLKRLLVLSTVEDVGFLLLGVASATRLGTTGALVAAATHALAKALLFTCLAALKPPAHSKASQLASSRAIPVSAFGFLFGMLAMLGIPPTLGFIGRWRLYETAVADRLAARRCLHPLVDLRAHRLRPAL